MGSGPTVRQQIDRRPFDIVVLVLRGLFFQTVNKYLEISLGDAADEFDSLTRPKDQSLRAPETTSLDGRGRMPVTRHPPTYPGVRNYRTGLLPQVVTHGHCARFFHPARRLSYPVKCLLQGIPALRPVPVTPSQVPLGQPPSLHDLRGSSTPLNAHLRLTLGRLRRFHLRARVGSP